MSKISLYSNDLPDYFIIERTGLGSIAKIQTQVDRVDASFEWTGSDPGVKRGSTGQLRRLEPSGYVLQIADFDGYRIHGKNFEGITDPAITYEVREESIFVVEEGLIDSNQRSFRSVKFPDRYLRHRDHRLYAEPVRFPAELQSATFRVKGALSLWDD